MFRHRGKNRNFKHNLGIATLLSFVAGLVNVVGFLATSKLTSNVTGHFTFIVEDFHNSHYIEGLFYLVYVLFFLFGAFFASFIIELTNKINDKFIYIVPVLTELTILTTIGLLHYEFIIKNPNIIVCALLFAMGLQNSLVTSISKSVVRTTHLTGLFTDLGIELSQLFFFKLKEQRAILTRSINLRLSIIFSFFIGGIVGGFFFLDFKMKTLLIASVLLILGLTLDTILIKIKWKLRKGKIIS